MSANPMRTQLRQHSVALISLIIALTGLAYNTWRNEQTEANRNVRTAGIELLLKLGELEQVVFFRHYENDEYRGSPRAGWTYVLTIRDLSTLTSSTIATDAEYLLKVWAEQWSGLGAVDSSADEINASIERLRGDMLGVLSRLD